MNENDLRDCFAMFAMMGLTAKYGTEDDTNTRAQESYRMADAMLEARKPQAEAGITAIRKRRIKE
jgi:hypothetical protein